MVEFEFVIPQERKGYDPYDKMFELLYDRGMRDSHQIADKLGYKVSFVERYIKSLRKKGWIIEEGKEMRYKP